MATAFIGFYRPVGTYAVDVFRDTGAAPPALVKKVNEFPSKLPATCKLVGSWQVAGGVAPSVIVVETEDVNDLVHINTYYGGWLEFDWHPTRSVPRDN